MKTYGQYLLDTCVCIALHENFVLVTGNVDHFERIHGLKVENWMV